MASRLAATLPMLRNSQLVVELIHVFKNNRIITLQKVEKFKDTAELLQCILLQIPKSSYSQISLSSLSSIFLSLQNELAEIFNLIPYDECLWNDSCKNLSAKIAVANNRLENLQKIANQTTKECQQALDSLYNLEAILSNANKYNSIVQSIEGIFDFLALIPNSISHEYLSERLTLIQIEQKIHDWTTRTIIFCKTTKSMNFEDNMMIGEVVED